VAIEHARFSAEPYRIGGGRYNLVGFVLCASLLIWRIVSHAFWRDEAQAWLIVQAADSFWDLFILQHEGHPPLYYWILYFVSSLGDDLWLVRIPTLIFSTGSLAVLWFFTPFTPLERLAISLGYLLSWEYGVFSRSYIVGVFFILAYAAFFGHWRRHPILGGLTLGAAALTHVFFAMAAACLAGLTALLWLKQKASPKEILLFATSFGVCFALSVASVVLGYPPTEAAAGVSQSVTRLEHQSLWRPLHRMANPFLRGVPLLKGITLAGVNLPSLLEPFFDLLVFGLLVACFWRNLTVGLIFLIGAAGVVGFRTIIYGGSTQDGVIYILFVAVYGIAYVDCNKVAARGLLALSMLGGLLILPQTLITPYSASQEAANIIKARGLEQATWVAFPDAPGTATFAALKRSVYGLQCQCDFTYVDRTRPQISLSSVQELAAAWREFLAVHRESEVFVLVSKPNVDKFHQIVGDQALDLITKTQPALNPSESFVIYRVRAKRGSTGF